MRRRLLWLATAAALIPAPVLAQNKPPPPKPPTAVKPPQAKPPTVGEVTVTGQGNEVRTSVDRRSYSVAGDLAATTGSVGDALRNIPSVDVDVQGNLSLRGDPNVTILIDGKPSALFSGQGRADALQRLPANSIERVEVITNPSAALNPEGSGGVINLITKKAKGVGGSGTVRAVYGSQGRMNAGVSGGYNSKKLALTGDAFFGHQNVKQAAIDQRRSVSLATGQTTATSQDSHFKGRGDFWSAHGGVDYDLSETLRLSAEASHFGQSFDNDVRERFASFTPSGAPAGILDRIGEVENRYRQYSGSTSFRKSFTGDQHELTGDLDYQLTDGHTGRQFANLQVLPTGPTLFEDIPSDFTERQTKLKVEYKRPLPDAAKLVAGYELQADDNAYDNLGSRGASPGSLVPDPALDNRFRFQQAVNSAYATYERPFGDFSVQAGLRLEQVRLDLDQLSQGVRGSNDYFRAYPSLHLGYKILDSRQLSFSYSHRIQRPQPYDLNPFRSYVDAFNYREGNPRLEPAETHSYELAYQYRKNQSFYLATAYYRQRYNEVTDVVRDIGGGVFVTTRANLGESRSGGLELVANSRFTKKLTFNLSGNLYWNELEARALGFSETRSGWTLAGRANLNWAPNAKDFVQVNLSAQGKQLTPQGYRLGSTMLNMGYRHKFNDKVSFIAQAQDVLDSFRQTVVLDTPTLQGRVEREVSVRGVFVGLIYNFGGPSRRRQPDFDFGGGAAPPT